jgi:hypothetical protein
MIRREASITERIKGSDISIVGNSDALQELFIDPKHR